MLSSLPLQVLLYFNGWYDVVLMTLMLLLYIWKAAELPYPKEIQGTLALEISLVFGCSCLSPRRDALSRDNPHALVAGRWRRRRAWSLRRCAHSSRPPPRFARAISMWSTGSTPHTHTHAHHHNLTMPTVLTSGRRLDWSAYHTKCADRRHHT